MRITRKRLAGFTLNHRLIFIDNLLPTFSRDIGILNQILITLITCNHIFKFMMIDSQNHIAIHLDKPAIRIPRKTRITRARLKAFNRLVIQPQIEHRIHHPRHRYARTRAHRHQKRVLGIPELRAHLRLNPLHPLFKLCFKLRRILFLILVISRANFGGNRKTRRHRKPQTGHLRQIRPFSTQKITHRGITFIMLFTEAIYPFSHTLHSP